jgi:hypothetical protein
MVGTPVAKQPKKVEDEAPAPTAKTPGKPTSTKLYEEHAKKLSELAREEELEGGAAEAFGRHFGTLLDNLLIAAKQARLRKLQSELRGS